jgi:type I restriction enzyme S subunit
MAKKEIEQTEIEAPYELPEGWKWDLAKNLAEIYTGNSINEKVKQEKYLGQTEGLNFIATKDIDFDGTIKYENGVKINDHEKFKIAPKNTPLLCIEGGSAGRKLGFSVEDVCFGNKLCAFVCKNINPKLLYFYLQSNFFYHCFMKERHGLIGGVSVNTLKQIPFPLPPTLAEQQRIVNRIESMFAKLDEAKEKAQNVVDSFETRKAAILHKAFTNQLKIENGKLKDEDWEETTLGNVLIEKPRNGYSPTSVDYVTPYKTMSLSATTSGYFRPEFCKYIDEDISEDSFLWLKPGDILIQRANSLDKVGTSAIYTSGEHEFIYPDLMMKLQVKESVSTKFIAYQLKTEESMAYFRNNATGTAGNMPKINQKTVCNLPIKLPPFNYQLSIVNFLDSVLEKENKAKQAAEAVLEQIDLLKKSILARAFRGEL